MAALKETDKMFIVQRLACFDTPSQVVERVKLELDIEVTRQQVMAYNPLAISGKRLSQDLQDLFFSTRKAFQENLLDIPIANKSVRLKELQAIFENAGSNRVLKMDALQQAAKEMGGMFENQRLEKDEPKDDVPKGDYRLNLEPDEAVPDEPIL